MDNEYIVIKIFLTYSYKTTYIWYSIKFSGIEYILITTIIIIVLNKIVEKRFRIYLGVIIQRLFRNKYNIKDLQRKYILQSFANLILRNAKAIEQLVEYNQLIIIWNKLLFDFQLYIKSF